MGPLNFGAAYERTHKADGWYVHMQAASTLYVWYEARSKAPSQDGCEDEEDVGYEGDEGGEEEHVGILVFGGVSTDGSSETICGRVQMIDVSRILMCVRHKLGVACVSFACLHMSVTPDGRVQFHIPPHVHTYSTRMLNVFSEEAAPNRPGSVNLALSLTFESKPAASFNKLSIFDSVCSPKGACMKCVQNTMHNSAMQPFATNSNQ